MNDIVSAMDLSTWTETAGVGSVDHVVCPHCKTQFEPAAAREPGLYHCGTCRAAFELRITDSPLGKAYLTVPATEVAVGAIRCPSCGHGYEPSLMRTGPGRYRCGACAGFFKVRELQETTAGKSYRCEAVKP